MGTTLHSPPEKQSFFLVYLNADGKFMSRTLIDGVLGSPHDAEFVRVRYEQRGVMLPSAEIAVFDLTTYRPLMATQQTFGDASLTADEFLTTLETATIMRHRFFDTILTGVVGLKRGITNQPNG